MTESTKEDKKSKTETVTKEVSLTPFLTNIFKPSAELVGQELKNYLQEKFDTWKEKRRAQNISDHIQKVQEKISLESDESIQQPSNSINQLDLFTEWADGAQNVGADEGVLAKLWQQLLMEIANGNSPDKVLIEKLKGISPEEASLLLKLHEKRSIMPRSEKELHYLESLEQKSLVASINIIPITVLILGAWCSIMFFAASFKDTFGEYGLIQSLNNFELWFFGFPLIMSVMVGYQMLRKKRMYKWRLSWMGQELVKGIGLK